MSSDFFEGYEDRMTERIEKALGQAATSCSWWFGGGEGDGATLLLDGCYSSDELSTLNAALARAIDEEERWRCGIE